MLLYIVRHGDPNYQIDALTPKGICQAEALARRLGKSGIDEIYSSPLGRAMQTAKPTADILKLDIKIEEWMSESLAWNDLSAVNENGERKWFFANQRSHLLKDGDALRQDWYNHPEATSCPTAKRGYERIQGASNEFIERLGYKHDGHIYKVLKPNQKRIAAFCHAGFGLTWLSHLLSVPPLVFWAGFDISHSGVTILEFLNHESGVTTPICLAHSDLSHIYEAQLPMEYNNMLKI